MPSDLTVETERKWLDLSLAQQAVWLDAKLSGSAAYQLGAWVRITGSPDESVLRQAISLTMARHDGLRLRVDDELPRQWLDESVEPPFAVLDLAPGVTDPDAAFQAHVEDRFSIPMPLGDHPLFSVELIRVGANLNYMLWRFHHLLADSASVSIAIAHGLNAYEALAGGTQELTPGSSYLKTISADAAYLESAAYQKDLAYWSSRFEPLPPALIADLEARPTGENKVPFAEWKLEGEDFKEFQDAARTAGTTIQRALFALFTMALGRRYGQSDIVSGVALHRRDLATRHTVGMMAGVIAMRCQFDAYWTLEECIQAYSEQLDRDLRHQRLPVDILSRALGLAGTGRAGLFEAAMSYVPSSRGWKESAVEGLPFTAGHVVTKEASPISLGANESESGDALDITIAINTDYLDAAEAQTLLTLLKTACHQFLHAPDICFENLPTLTPGEQSLVVTQWNKTATMFESGTLDGLFAAQVKRTPEAIAVVGRDGQSLTYAVLDEQSTRLARALAAHGIKPERVVGVKMERSAETIIALLAILKAGGVYLPLDPAYPKERLEYMVYDAGALLVLESINDLSGDADLPSLSDPRFNDPRRLAYIIYTSGTTGLPKGVEVPHSAPVNLAFARRACHDPLGVGDRVLAGISVGFDVSIGQLLLPLLSGATVVIADDLKSMGADEFWALLAKQQVTHINSVPSFLDSILSAAPAASTLALKRLMLGGEALSGALVARIQRMLPGVEVVNMYGPTEACVDATFHVATQADLSAPVLPIGKPLSNYRAYVLNSLLEPVGVGVTGELVLGGAGIARGYVNAADLTSDRFVADPFSPDPVSSKPGDRLYRTGDRARWRADGVLEFLGRVDQQVKIRGFRVEPGEIAATLLQHPDVSQAVVVARAHQTSAALRLVAYVVPRGSDALPETSDLRAFLSERLPDYMVPAAFVSIAAIPLSRNGKLDEKALPSPDLRDGEYVAPRSAAEETVAKLFAEVLGLERCGATDNFFELGGHSLMAVSLIERLKRQGIPVSVRSLFLTPTVAGLASSIDAQTAEVAVPANLIPPDCTAITPEMLPLVKLSQEQIDRIAASIPGGAANIQDIYPLAPLQEGILFQHRIAPKGDPYLTQSLFSFDNRARLDRFIGALDPVIARHDVLRTAIRWKEIDQPVQVVLRAAVARIEEVELDTSSTVSPAAQLTQRFHPNTYRIELTDAPLLRAITAYDQAQSRWLLLVLTHHLILDQTSVEILVGELHSLMADPHATLPASLPYRNFVAEARYGTNQDEQTAFFTRMLAGVDEPTTPFGLVDVAAESTEIGESRLRLDPSLARRIREQARVLGVTPASLFHTAWAAVVSQLSGKSSVVFGTILFGRMRGGAGADRVVGMFINTLPIRLDIDSMGVAASAVRTHRLLAELMVHEHAPLALAQRCSAVPPPAPLFSSLFNYRYRAEDASSIEWPGVELVDASERTNYPLAMAVDDSGTNFLLTVLASFPEAGRERVCRYLQQSMASLVDLLEREPDTALEKLQVVPGTERHMVLEEWNRTDANFEHGTLDELVAAQTRRTPDALAVIGRDGKELTYAELDAQSAQLARQLVANGVRPEQVVGVRMERSVETIIALLAILKAGGVYLPLDPAYPADRLDYMAKDAGAVLVLESIHCLQCEAELPQLIDPNRIAYIIYTSGTTGRPKGVAVPHTAPVNLAFARRACHDPIGPGDRILAAISVGFDVSIGQLLLPLLSGAAVVVADDLKTMGASGFWAFLAQRRVSHINSVPSFFDSVLDAAPSAGTLALKRIMLGGESLRGSLVARIQNSLPGVEVVNMYGPTEACIDATFHVATSADISEHVLPIGRPLKNYRVYVLDERMEPVGIGLPGELYLAGAGLAHGYLNAPELTAARFVKDPFSATPGDKLYRTGDRALWRADGVLEFLGRADNQIKIRGFRVELGEIEAQLSKQPGVREAAVIAQNAPSGARLIAYFCGDESVEIETLRSGTAGELPDYMVPSAFIRLDKLPLSANGKLDRNALLNLGESASAAHIFEPPVGELEEKMAALWAELLKVDKVGRHDNFFELGGHSLLAMTLIERMHQQGIASDVRALFGTPTIAGLAAASASSSLQPAAPGNLILPGTQHIKPDMLPLVKLSQEQIDKIVKTIPGGAANVQDLYPLAPLQEGIVFQHLVATQGDPYLAPFLLAFDHRERLDEFVAALETIIARHDVLRMAIISRNVDAPLQVVLREVIMPLEEFSLDSAADAQTQILKRFDPATFRLDLSQAPLLRAFFAHDTLRNRWLLLMLTHHLILDHTSLAIMVGELRALMTDAQANLPIPIPYRNFIAQTIQDSNADEHEPFFRRLVGDVDEPTAPFGLIDTQVNASETSESKLRFDLQFSRRIREQARLLGVTPASFFHVAWASVLSFVSGKSDVVFGTLLLGRMRSGAGADRAVGMFINTLPIRLAIDKTGVRQSVISAQRLLAELMAHEHAPLALAQRASSVPAPAPLFSSLLNYRYSPEDAEESPWPGVEMVHASERTNYPVSMAVDDSDSFFTIRALAHPKAGATRVNQYLHRAVEGLLDLLERAPDTPIQSLCVMPPSERHLVVEDWNRTEVPFEQATLDALFLAQTQRTPTAIAIVGKDGTPLTYAALDLESTRLARQLVANGVEPERVVGVRLERSAETVIAFLAILKAGGVYLPLDPAYPQDRLDYMAQDAGAFLILDSIRGLKGDADLPHLIDPNRLAYIIYTSGTTGKPKGVAISHTAPVNLAFARRACHDPLSAGDRVLAAISVGFDVSIGQLLLPLLSGATVVIAGDLKTMAPAEFWGFLAERQVTHINSVPSFFDSILDSAPPADSLALKRLMLGGEPLSGALVARIKRALPKTQVVNMYGPTEACIDATYHIPTESDLSAAVVPIGRPLSNYRAYILDSHLQPVGVGIPGELYLGGAGLARGYVNAPELTTERFLTDPFSDLPGARMYRTGDRVQWRADGAIEFLGRVDQQVKVRGFRVEPGEIEAQLRNHPGVREVAVIPYTAYGDTRLIAYYCGEDSVETEALRESVASQLPDYMVPSAFVKLAKLPLSANGKLDRKALPVPDKLALVSRAFEPPVGEVEEKMAALWAEVLKVDKIGRYDNFFELGGHSLLAMTLIQRLQQEGLASDVRSLFTTPTVAGLAAASATSSLQIAAPDNLIPSGAQHITPEMLPLVKLTQPQIDHIAASMPGGAPNIQDIYPLAPLQQGILYQHLLTTEGDPYLAPFLLGFDQRDRLDSFVAALQNIADRHDVLRTAIVWKDVDSPVQVVLRQVAVPVVEVSCDTHPGAPDLASQLCKRFDAGAYRLDLSQAPLLRAFIAHDAANNRWLLSMISHHLIIDHASLAIVIGELRALMADPNITFPDSVPYRNFVAQTIHDAATADHEGFFKRLLGDVDEPTAPFGLLDTQANASEAAEGTLRLNLQISNRIRESSRKLGITPASLFHVAWAKVLSFISGKSDVVFGTLLLGRMRSGAGADRAVGMFINTLPIRFAIDKTGVQQSVISAQKLLAELMAHEHSSLAAAQRASAVPAPTPLFSSLFNYRFSPDEEIAWPGVEMIHSSERTNYPVSMAVDDSGSVFIFRAIAHPKAGADRLNEYLQNSIEGLIDLLEHAPEAPIQSLSVMPPNERQLVVDEWNRTDATFEHGTLDTLFSAQARLTPAAVAVIAEDGSTITYSELDAQSTHLARQLVASGVQPERVVGVRMERSAETVIAFLAILKAGGVYLPLDPAYPPGRLNHMIEDSGPMLILDSIHGLSGDVDLPVLTDPNRLAYIIYTSGTTGKPKGVAVPHTAPVNLAFARRACHDPLSVGDRVLAAISVGFDVSIGQLLLPLLSGATVVIAGDLKTIAPVEFWAFLAQRQVTHINSVPSFFDSILDSAPPANSLALKRLMLGGEPLSGALVARIKRSLPETEVVNMYGPTEACIDATYHIPTESDLSAAVLPIGRPLSNYRAYILDSHLQPVGVGIPGELYLGGIGLARGYLNASELTAERFLTDPFSDLPGARMYRTGDRVQWRADGAIDFLGRVDKQIKIRGHRIELGEIEAALLLHPAVARAAVVADHQSSGNTRLIAYVVAAAGLDQPQPQQLRDYLAAHLPDYMTPSVFCPLPELPLTPNGKLDFKALPKVSAERSESVPFVPPSSATEIALQQIWQQLLGVDPIGIHDNFFALGGHSLAAMRLLNLANTHFKFDLQLRTLFDCPTIAQLAATIDNRSAAPEIHPSLVPLRASGTKKPLFCIHAAGGHVMGYAPLANAIEPDQPVWGLQARALSPGQPLADSIEQMAADYIQAIRAVQPVGPYQLLGHSSGGILAYEVAQQLHQAGEKVSFLCLLDTLLPEKLRTIDTGEEFIYQLAVNIGLDDLVSKHDLPATETEMLARAQAAGRLKDLAPAQFERFYSAFRNSLGLYPKYVAKPWSGPFVLFRALKSSRKTDDLAPDWSHLVSPNAINVAFDCTHLEFADEKVAPSLARVLERLMADANMQQYPVRQGHLIPLQANGTKRKLFCIHPAGGNALCYLPVAHELGPDQPVYALQASGLEEGEPLPASIKQMASDYLAAMREIQPAGPYQLLGMSSGGVIAFEMARQLKALSEEVGFLGMLDTGVPRPGGDHKLSAESLLQAMATELSSADLLKNSAPATNLAELVDTAIKAGRLPANYTLAQAERISVVFQNTVRLHFAYQPQPWQTGPVLFVRALRRDSPEAIPPDWSPFITDLQVVDLDCTHSDLVTPALSATIAALVARHLK